MPINHNPTSTNLTLVQSTWTRTMTELLNVHIQHTQVLYYIIIIIIIYRSIFIHYLNVYFIRCYSLSLFFWRYLHHFII